MSVMCWRKFAAEKQAKDAKECSSVMDGLSCADI